MIKEGLQKLKEKKLLDALDIFHSLDRLNSKNSDILFCLGNVYYELNDLNKSVFYFEQSYKNNPTSEIIINNYAIALQSLGKIEDAKLLFNKLIGINPNNIKAYYRLFRINVKEFENNYIEKVRTLENKDNLSLEDKSLISYMLSKHAQRNNNINTEIKLLKKAHEFNFEFKQKYNLNLSNYYIKILPKQFDQMNFYNQDEISSDTKKREPIFIIGLPRSGSTLIESLLSHNNKKFYSYGESGIFQSSMINQIKNNFSIGNTEFNIDLGMIDKSIKDIYNYSKEKNFIDKSLENFFYIDLILKIFPNAKFIHTYRNRYDAAIAIYQSMLIYLPWAHSLNNILLYILNYEKIIKFFEKKYSKKIFNVDLEELTINSKQYTKKIFDFCNIEWNDNVFEFYKSRNVSSKSSSFLQIRDKIHRYEKNKYKPYYSLIENNKEINF